MLKKVIITVFALSLVAQAIPGQSVAELAKKEKARRAKLQGKRGPVITNADLASKGKSGTKAKAKAAPPRVKSQPSAPVTDNAIPVVSSDPQTQVDRREPLDSDRVFATRVHSEFEVLRPGNALKKPDGAYAEVKYYGYLDVEIELVNGEGNDLAIYARGPRVGIMPEEMAYAVFAGPLNAGDEDWIFLGKANGTGEIDTFDLGELKSARLVRIMYRMFPASRELTKPIRFNRLDYAMMIDAVRSLH